jgi:nicotinic acid mononucleotide adenylyltransferase
MSKSAFENFGEVAQALGLPVAAEFSAAQLLDGYKKAIADNRHAPEDIRLAYKLARDPFYRRAFQHYGSFAKIEDAGFFDDELSPGALDRLYDPQLRTTSLDKVTAPLSSVGSKAQTEKTNIVLLTTGAFAPVHEGHLEMMEVARTQLSAEGFRVLGGFIAPAHDYYVHAKGQKADLWTSEKRLAALDKVLETSDWLSTDPWMCRHTPTDLMFTDVIMRLEAYLAWNIPGQKKIEVAYVFGGDHAAHARTFLKHGMGICVNNRKGYEDDFAKIEQEFVEVPGHRMFFIQTTVSDRSSSDIRLGKQPLMDVLADTPALKEITIQPVAREELSFRPKAGKTTDNDFCP